DVAQTLVGQPHTGNHARREILYHQIAMRDETQRYLDRSGIAQVERDAALALIPLIEAAGAIDAGFAVSKRRNKTIDLGFFYTFNPNPLSPEMRQLQSAKGPLPHPGKIQHSNPFEGPVIAVRCCA